MTDYYEGILTIQCATWQAVSSWLSPAPVRSCTLRRWKLELSLLSPGSTAGEEEVEKAAEDGAPAEPGPAGADAAAAAEPAASDAEPVASLSKPPGRPAPAAGVRGRRANASTADK
jgi:hypothetical protein